MTEVGFESANHGVQIYGGHGYIASGVWSKTFATAAFRCLYEGTTGIQALDLLGRKILMTQGEALKKASPKSYISSGKTNETNDAIKEFVYRRWLN